MVCGGRSHWMPPLVRPIAGAGMNFEGTVKMSGMVISTPRLGTAVESSFSVGSSTATQLASANTNRKVLLIQNLGSVGIYLSTLPGVSASAGYLLGAGATFQDTFTNGPWYAIAASSTASVRTIEVS